jgi:hypothetical protein
MYDIGPHVNDIGSVLELTVKNCDGTAVDISAASTMQMKFTKPGGTVLSANGVFTTNGSDGKLRYTTVVGDLSERGTWKCRAYLAFPGGWSGHTSYDKFTVYS